MPVTSAPVPSARTVLAVAFATIMLAPAAHSTAHAETATTETATIAVPRGGVANYDPSLSAKEAVLANWDLAASGIRAGEVVGGRVVALADRGAPFDRLARQAASAQRTLVQRWNAAQWIYEAEPDLARLDGAALHAVAVAASAECAADPCEAELVALRDAFAAATNQLGAVAVATRAAVNDRMAEPDAALMTEQLGLVADYLEGGTWAEGLALTELGRDPEEVAARLVGALSLWRNVEPYVGLANPEIDAAINREAERLLRTLRLETRRTGTLDPAGAEMAALRERASTLAAEFRRAASLFSV